MNSINTSAAQLQTKECPVCCRQVTAELFSTHVNICMDRSGDCDVGVIITSPNGGQYPYGRSSSTCSLSGGPPRAQTAVGGGVAVSGRVGGGSGESTASDTAAHEQQHKSRPATAVHQPNNSQYYRHYNDNYYTPADALHRSASIVNSGDHRPDDGGSGKAAEGHDPMLGNMRFGSPLSDTENATSGGSKRPVRFEVGLVLDTSCEGPRDDLLAGDHNNSNNNQESSSASPSTTANSNSARRVGSILVDPLHLETSDEGKRSTPPQQQQQAHYYTPATVTKEKVQELLDLFTGSLDIPSTTAATPLATKEALIREALSAANDDANVAAMLLLEAGSGWAAPSRDESYNAADSIETPRGSLGSGRWGTDTPPGVAEGTVISGRDGIGHRVVYASKPPSRSNSRNRVTTTSSSWLGASPPTVVTSSRHNTVTTALDDEITAAVIGGPLSGNNASNSSNAAASSTTNNNSNNNALHYLHHHHFGGPGGMGRPSTTPVSARRASGPGTQRVAAPNTSPTSQSGASSSSAAAASNPPTVSPPPASSGGRSSSKVELIIYDLKPDMSVAKRLGFGAYHSAVVVYGSEIAYGGSTNLTKDAGKSGIWASKPGRAAQKIHERVMIGETHHSAAQVRAFIKELGVKEFIVDSYHLLSNNCNHFSQRFLQFLGEKGRLTPDSAYFVQKYGSGGYGAAIASAQAKNNKKLAKNSKKSAEGGGEGSDLQSVTSNSTNNGGLRSDSFSSSSTSSSLFYPSVNADQAIIDKVCSDPAALKAAFQLPAYVNRAAAVGNKVVPDFILRAFMQKVAPPTTDTPTNKNKGKKGAEKNFQTPMRPATASVSSNYDQNIYPYNTPSRATNGTEPISPYPLPTPNTERGYSSGLTSGNSFRHGATNVRSLGHGSTTRREYEGVCFIAAALGLVLTPSALAMGDIISSSPGKEDLEMTIPEEVLQEDRVFLQCLKVLRNHGGDTSAALEQLVAQAA